MSTVQRRVVSARAVHSMQFVLLFASLTYGARFLLPVGAGRSPIYDYVVTSHTPIWLWGGLIVSACGTSVAAAFLAERVRSTIWGWVSVVTHAILAAVFFTLGLAGFWYSVEVQTSGAYGPWHWGELLGAMNRPAQLWLLAYLHGIFVRRTDESAGYGRLGA